MNVLTIVTHPRRDSLTFAIAHEFIHGLAESDHVAEILDLYQNGFDPVLNVEDEPDWEHPGKLYSSAVVQEMQRLEKYDALVFVFPVWWYSLPAIAKGYVDRVFNYGFAYGPVTLKHAKLLWLAVAGESRETYSKRGYDTMMERWLNVSIGEYIGIKNSQVEFFYNNMEASKEEFEAMLTRAHELGRSFTR